MDYFLKITLQRNLPDSWRQAFTHLRHDTGYDEIIVYFSGIRETVCSGQNNNCVIISISLKLYQNFATVVHKIHCRDIIFYS